MLPWSRMFSTQPATRITWPMSPSLTSPQARERYLFSIIMAKSSPFFSIVPAGAHPPLWSGRRAPG